MAQMDNNPGVRQSPSDGMVILCRCGRDRAVELVSVAARAGQPAAPLAGPAAAPVIHDSRAPVFDAIVTGYAMAIFDVGMTAVYAAKARRVQPHNGAVARQGSGAWRFTSL